MRVFITVLVLIFSFQSWTKAEDISDFQIEGISIGDSLLDYFSEEEILKNKYDYKDDEFKSSDIISSAFKTYDGIQISFKSNDEKYIIYGISGAIFFKNNIAECYKKKDEIFLEMKELFKNAKIDDQGTYPHPGDGTGESTVTSVYFDFTSGNYAQIKCFDWSEEKGYADHLRIGIITKALGDFFAHKAH